MAYLTDTDYPGYIYDDFYDEYITPKGRLVRYPGAPFHGMLNAAEFQAVKDVVESVEPFEGLEEDVNRIVGQTKEEDMTVVLTETITIDDVTINVYDVVVD